MDKVVKVSAGEAGLMVRRREAELRFCLPPDKVGRLSGAFLSKGKRWADRCKLAEAIDLLVDAELPDQTRETIPVELLNLPPAEVLRATIAYFSLPVAEGVNAPEVGKAILRTSKRDSARLRQADQ